MTTQTPTALTAQEILALEQRAQSFVPESEARRPSTFLTLAPTLSASYPTRKPSVPIPVISKDALPAAEAVTEEGLLPAEPAVKVRRSSSSTSEGSAGGQRFLKLGPVHWGEGDGKGDWSEISVAE